jgi:Ca2+/H+ antiporter
MIVRLRSFARQWTVVVPVIAVVLLAFTWGRDLPAAIVALVTLVLAGSVLAAVHHAEVVAHRVGEPFGSLVLAVAVTIIEVALIVTLMADGGAKSSTLARDTVFAAVMITCNGIVGLCLLVASLRHGLAVFNAEGTGAALATVATLATLSLVFPTFTTSKPGPEFSTAQLTFAALASLVLYALFVTTQTVTATTSCRSPDRARSSTWTTTPTPRRPGRPASAWDCSAWPWSAWSASPKVSRPPSSQGSKRPVCRTPWSVWSSRCSCCSPRRSQPCGPPAATGCRPA